TDYEQAAGRARLEYLSKMSGRPLYLMQPLNIDHYGTPDRPIMVDSVEGERIVGCTGFPKDSHEPLWMWVRQSDRTKGPPTRCPEGGQAFEINKLGGEGMQSHHTKHPAS